MHAGMVARALIEPRLRIPVTVSIASEFRYEEPLIDDSTLTIVISQSGETIDTLAALRLGKGMRFHCNFSCKRKGIHDRPRERLRDLYPWRP